MPPQVRDDIITDIKINNQAQVTDFKKLVTDIFTDIEAKNDRTRN